MSSERKSSRTNKGKLPQYLSDFVVNINPNMSSESNDNEKSTGSVNDEANDQVNTGNTEENILSLNTRLRELEEKLSKAQVELSKNREENEQLACLLSQKSPNSTVEPLPVVTTSNAISAPGHLSPPHVSAAQPSSGPLSDNSQLPNISSAYLHNMPSTYSNVTSATLPHYSAVPSHLPNTSTVYASMPGQNYNMFTPVTTTSYQIPQGNFAQPNYMPYYQKYTHPNQTHFFHPNANNNFYSNQYAEQTNAAGNCSYNPHSFPTYTHTFTSGSASYMPSCPNADSKLSNVPPTHDNRRKLHDLPEFYGKPEEWPMFISTFNESTAAYNYTNLENTFRLQKSLKGLARETVESLLIHPSNVSQVISQLEFRFGRADCLVRSQLSKVKEISPVDGNHLEQLIPFSTKVQNLSTFLETTNSIQHLANPSLMDDLISKLPMNQRLEWAKYSRNIKPYPTVKDFSGWLSQEAKLVTLVTPITVNKKFSLPAERKPQNKNNRNKLFHVKDPQPATHVFCIYCKKNHAIQNCFAFKKIAENQRWNFVKSNRLCFCCLREGHHSNLCSSKRTCGINNCKRNHHPVLHESLPSASNMNGNGSNVDSSTSSALRSDDGHSAVLSVQKNNLNPVRSLLFKILPVTLYGPDGNKVSTYAFLDEGSSITMVDDEIVNSLGVRGKPEELTIQWFGNKTTTLQSTVVNLQISGIKRFNKKFNLKNIRAVKNLALPTQTLDLNDLHYKYRHLKNLPIAEFNCVTPKILIGIDHSYLGLPTGHTRSSFAGPAAIRTKLGWIVYGPAEYRVENCNNRNAVFLSQAVSSEKEDDLHQIVKDYFTTENFGVKQPDKLLESLDDARAREILENSTVKVENRYQTGLLWKTDEIELPSSYEMAVRRMVGIENKMRRDPEFATKYENQLMSYVEKGYAEKLSAEQEKIIDEKTWYLPHFAVTNPNKPDKMRIVFDAAASVKGASLNSMLLKGPDQYQSLPAVLSKFREYAIAVCGDIKEMFSQILIQPSDRNSQRFLWRHGDATKPVEIYIMKAMTFGATCSPCSAQYVKNRNAYEFSQQYPEAVKAIVENHYVDDFVNSFATEGKAIEISEAIKFIHLNAGFELRNFVSNSRNVADLLNDNEELLPENLMNMNIQSESSADKILGMFWNTNSDELVFQLKFNRVPEEVVNGVRRPTKREVLSLTMSVFDPFGFLSNFMVGAKIILQELWKTGIDWDDVLPDNIYSKWMQWQNEIRNIKSFSVQRCYSLNLPEAIQIQLHVFVDASESAFAAVAYWRIKSAKSIDVSFVAGKTRCAPQKLLSVPRLELQAAVLGTRLMNSIVESHNIKADEVYLWSDSKTVIGWIRSNHRQYKPFVSHRISEILDSSEVRNWLWVPTKLNPADDATRAKFPPKFEAESQWLKGPKFLYDDNVWPDQPKDLHNSSEEIRRCHVVNIVEKIKLVIEVARYSSFLRLKRVTAWVLRYLENFKANVRKLPARTGELSATEINNAELELCRRIQSEIFTDELLMLKENKSIPKSSSIFSLSPMLDSDGLIKVNGRINAATCVSDSTKKPIILPKGHIFTKLVIEWYHRNYHHQNQELIIAEIRRKYWVPNIRSLANQCKSNCQNCKIKRAKPRPPLMGQLPIDRLMPFVRPFTYAGLDYFGPYHVTIGRRREKRWVALFTCLTMRAIHLELAADLSADACILCIRNFVNRKGVPVRIRCDNGTNFVAAAKEMKSAANVFDSDRVQQELSSKNIEWVFNSPSNPEAGGCWERLVQCVKRVLSYTLKEESPREHTLVSLLIEAENIINSRPLTHLPVSSENEDPLTPNHFLLGTTNSTQTPFDDKGFCYRKQWRISQQLKNKFWRRWVEEYLPTLTRRTKWFEKVGPIKIGDLVFVCDSDVPRSRWRRGRVVKVFPGADGQVRAAEVKTMGGILRRPAVKLAVLDVIGDGESHESGSIHGGGDVVDSMNAPQSAVELVGSD